MNNYDNNYYQKPKSITGLLVALVVSIVIFLTVTTILIVVLINDKKSNPETTEATAATTEAVTTEATELTTEATTETTEETTEATTEAPAVPYAEENGFSNWCNPYDGFELPIYNTAQFDDGTFLTADQIHINAPSGTYTFGDITRSEVYDNGYVTITVPYTVHYPMEINRSYSTDGQHITTYSSHRNFSFSDYYSGIKIRSGYDYDTNEYSSDFTYTECTWNGQTVSIGVLVSYEKNLSDYTEAGTDDFGHILDCTHEYNYVITFLVPADYDGLVLSVPTYGYSDEYYHAQRVGDVNQTHYVLGPDIYDMTYTPDELYFIRVNDYIR